MTSVIVTKSKKEGKVLTMGRLKKKNSVTSTKGGKLKSRTDNE